MPPGVGAKKRLLSRVQQYYYADDLLSRLALGSCGSRALPYETLSLAFNQDQLDTVFGAKLTDLTLDTEGSYREEGTVWWRPSGRVEFDPDFFYRVESSRDLFGNVTTFEYDAHSLLLESATDPLGNTVTATNDYRVLAPKLVTDPNGNRQAVAFDALGKVIKTAVMGKDGSPGGPPAIHLV